MKRTAQSHPSTFPELEALYEQAVAELLRPLPKSDREKLTAFCLAYRKEVAPITSHGRMIVTETGSDYESHPTNHFTKGLRSVVSN